MKRKLSLILAFVLLTCALLAGCSAKSGYVGTWVDEVKYEGMFGVSAGTRMVLELADSMNARLSMSTFSDMSEVYGWSDAGLPDGGTDTTAYDGIWDITDDGVVFYLEGNEDVPLYFDRENGSTLKMNLEKLEAATAKSGRDGLALVAILQIFKLAMSEDLGSMFGMNFGFSTNDLMGIESVDELLYFKKEKNTVSDLVNASESRKGSAENKSSGKSESDSSLALETYVDVRDWADGLYWGWDSDGNTMVVLNTDGNELFRLPEGRTLEEGFIGNYALISDGGIIDRSGNIVFELSNTDYTGIEVTRTLDAGCIICSQKVNTFDFTGTHYYLVNIQNGTAQLYDDFNPKDFRLYDQNKNIYSAYIYLGNGYLFFTDNRTITNIKNGSTIQTYMIDESGEKKENNTSLHGKENIHKDGDYIWFYDYSWYYDDYDLYSMNLVTGLVTLETAGRSISYVDNGVYQIKNYDNEVYLLNAHTRQTTPANGYSSIKVHCLYDDESYLVIVKNEGGGSFVTILNPDGSRRFEPINASNIDGMGDTYFVIRNDGAYQVYNTSGLQVANIMLDSVKYGKNTILYSVGNGSYSLLNVAAGTQIEVPGYAFDSLSDVREFTPDGYLFSSGMNGLLREDGTLVIFRDR